MICNLLIFKLMGLFVFDFSHAFIKPNGPMQVPFIGSIGFIWDLFRKRALVDILKKYRKHYGDLVELRTGPIRQYWITDTNCNLAIELLNDKKCCGRSQLKEPAFGDEFLFLTRELNVAKVRSSYIFLFH